MVYYHSDCHWWKLTQVLFAYMFVRCWLPFWAHADTCTCHLHSSKRKVKLTVLWTRLKWVNIIIVKVIDVQYSVLNVKYIYDCLYLGWMVSNLLRGMLLAFLCLWFNNFHFGFKFRYLCHGNLHCQVVSVEKIFLFLILFF